jgi:hypothetical protein
MPCDAATHVRYAAMSYYRSSYRSSSMCTSAAGGGQWYVTVPGFVLEQFLHKLAPATTPSLACADDE